MNNPFEPPKAVVLEQPEESADIAYVISGQKYLLSSMGIFLSMFILLGSTPNTFIHKTFAFIMLTIGLIGLYKIGKGLKTPIWKRIIVVILMFVPFINLLVLLGASTSATKHLRNVGYQVGFFGAKNRRR